MSCFRRLTAFIACGSTETKYLVTRFLDYGLSHMTFLLSMLSQGVSTIGIVSWSVLRTARKGLSHSCMQGSAITHFIRAWNDLLAFGTNLHKEHKRRQRRIFVGVASTEDEVISAYIFIAKLALLTCVGLCFYYIATLETSAHTKSIARHSHRAF